MAYNALLGYMPDSNNLVSERHMENPELWNPDGTPTALGPGKPVESYPGQFGGSTDPNNDVWATVTYGGGVDPVTGRTRPTFTMRNYAGNTDTTLRGLDPAVTQNLRSDLGYLDPVNLQNALGQSVYQNQYGTLTAARGVTPDNPYGTNASFAGTDARGVPMNWQGQYYGYVQQGPGGQTYVPGWNATSQFLGLNRNDDPRFPWSSQYNAYGGVGTPWQNAAVGTRIAGAYGGTQPYHGSNLTPGSNQRVGAGSVNRTVNQIANQPPAGGKGGQRAQPGGGMFGGPPPSGGKGGSRPTGGKGGSGMRLPGMRLPGLGMELEQYSGMGYGTPWPQQYDPYSYRAWQGGSSDPYGSQPPPGYSAGSNPGYHGPGHGVMGGPPTGPWADPGAAADYWNNQRNTWMPPSGGKGGRTWSGIPSGMFGAGVSGGLMMMPPEQQNTASNAVSQPDVIRDNQAVWNT